MRQVRLVRRASRWVARWRRLLPGVVVVVTLLGRATAMAQPASHAAPAGAAPAATHSAAGTRQPELEHRPRSEFEDALMGQLACVCGSCDLEPINTCKCEFAAQMRGELLAQLDGMDLSTEAARGVASEAVRSLFVERYGRKVLQPKKVMNAPPLVGWVVAAAVAVSLIILIRNGRRAIRRQRERRQGG